MANDHVRLVLRREQIVHPHHDIARAHRELVVAALLQHEHILDASVGQSVGAKLRSRGIAVRREAHVVGGVEAYLRHIVAVKVGVYAYRILPGRLGCGRLNAAQVVDRIVLVGVPGLRSVSVLILRGVGVHLVLLLGTGVFGRRQYTAYLAFDVRVVALDILRGRVVAGRSTDRRAVAEVVGALAVALVEQDGIVLRRVRVEGEDYLDDDVLLRHDKLKLAVVLCGLVQQLVKGYEVRLGRVRRAVCLDGDAVSRRDVRLDAHAGAARKSGQLLAVLGYARVVCRRVAVYRDLRGVLLGSAAVHDKRRLVAVLKLGHLLSGEYVQVAGEHRLQLEVVRLVSGGHALPRGAVYRSVLRRAYREVGRVAHQAEAEVVLRVVCFQHERYHEQVLGPLVRLGIGVACRMERAVVVSRKARRLGNPVRLHLDRDVGHLPAVRRV